MIELSYGKFCCHSFLQEMNLLRRRKSKEEKKIFKQAMKITRQLLCNYMKKKKRKKESHIRDTRLVWFERLAYFHIGEEIHGYLLGLKNYINF